MILDFSILKRLNIFIRTNIVPILLLFVFIALLGCITYYKVIIQVSVGSHWDTYAFLANALEFAGQSIGYSELERPPFLSFLVSIFFRLGYSSELTIFIVDGAIYLFGAIGLYLFLKLRFNAIQSFLGALLYSTFPIVLQWVAIGYTDIASVSFSIWALYFTVLANKKDSKFYYFSFPFLIMAFLTRYTAAIILFPMIFYILIEGNFLKNFKNMVLGILVSMIMLIPFLIFYYNKFDNPFFPFTLFSTAAEGSTALESLSYIPNPFYYINNLASYISAPGFLNPLIFYTIVIFLSIGLIIYFYNLLRVKFKDLVSKDNKLKITNTNTIAMILFLIFSMIFLATFDKISYMASELIFIILAIITFYFLRNYKNIDIDLLFLTWFMVFFIFHSVFPVKVDRYFITMAPAFSYFVILGLNSITDSFKFNFKKTNLTSWFLSCILVLMILSSTYSFLHSMPLKEDYVITNDAARTASAWLKNYDSNYFNKTIYSDIWPILSWNLMTNVKAMPTFKDPRAFSHELNKYHADYYFTIHTGLNLTNYNKITTISILTVYKKNQTKLENKPNMLYIGRNWQNYMEDVLDFKSFIIFKGGKYGADKSTFIDNYSPEELKSYSYVLLYNFAWHDQKKVEELLTNYAESGGTVVIDASGNLDGIFYNLDNSVFLDCIITKRSLSPYPNMNISSTLGNQTVIFSPFLSDNKTWYGASYEPIGDKKIDNLITADGNTVIGVQTVGKGKIIWIGYNFVWHAFHHENMQEEQLIQRSLGL